MIQIINCNQICIWEEHLLKQLFPIKTNEQRSSILINEVRPLKTNRLIYVTKEGMRTQRNNFEKT